MPTLLCARNDRILIVQQPLCLAQLSTETHWGMSLAGKGKNPLSSDLKAAVHFWWIHLFLFFFLLVENICSSSGKNSSLMCLIKTTGGVCSTPSLSCLTQHVEVTWVCRVVHSYKHTTTEALKYSQWLLCWVFSPTGFLTGVCFH